MKRGRPSKGDAAKRKEYHIRISEADYEKIRYLKEAGVCVPDLFQMSINECYNRLKRFE